MRRLNRYHTAQQKKHLEDLQQLLMTAQQRTMGNPHGKFYVLLPDPSIAV
jgi:hypothetical protein